MKWGYNWDLGPFETWDALGLRETLARIEAEKIALPAWVARMKEAGAASFYKGDEVWSPVKHAYVPRAKDPRRAPLAAVRRGAQPVVKNGGGAMWDLGDGVAGITLATKANSVD